MSDQLPTGPQYIALACVVANTQENFNWLYKRGALPLQGTGTYISTQDLTEVFF